MRTKNIVVLLILVILLCTISAGAYYTLQPQYKTISMSGITLEVPSSNASVQNNSANYNSYSDSKNNLSIKSWSVRDTNDINGSLQAGWDIGTQQSSNIGSNITYDNISVYNKSGTYTYYEEDIQKNYMIVITGTDINQVTHAVKTMNKTGIPQIALNSSITNMTSQMKNTSINDLSNNQEINKKTNDNNNNIDPDYDPKRDASHQHASVDHPVTVQQDDGEYTYYGPGHYDYYGGDNHMSGEYYKSRK